MSRILSLVLVGQGEQLDGSVEDCIEALTLPELDVEATVHFAGPDTADHVEIPQGHAVYYPTARAFLTPAL
ncbi:hypothetical protein SBA4_90011 [Candidatus Sulfopaludibacter sp. SbA4]|nr:hypothetical protein SBA4_90011 [Candidatus Sulfopaludibacter sp. SbA4]